MGRPSAAAKVKRNELNLWHGAGLTSKTRFTMLIDGPPRMITYPPASVWI